jgi:dienelactone hydrolase
MDWGKANATVHWMDWLFGKLAPQPLCLGEGWGESGMLELGAEVLQVREPVPLAPRWTSERRQSGVLVRDGVVPSPLERLAPECRDVHVRWLLPDGQRPRGVYVLLSSWGEEGYGRRTWLAARLLREGYGVMLLENAFYGLRRGLAQRGPILPRFSDLVLMGLATLQEARGLLGYLRAEGHRPGIAGYSMGGQMALMTGASIPWPLPIVGMAPSASPVAVLTEGPLQRGVAWKALGGGDPAGARNRLREELGRISVLALPPPADPSRAIIVGTARDGFVPPREMEAIARHWGAELRWIPAGHVSAVVFHRNALQQAMLDAFARDR